MSDVLWQGLMISVMGMSLTFLSLGLLVLMMILLERFTRSSVPAPVSDERASKQGRAAGISIRQTADEEIVAAIAVALARFRPAEVHPGDLGSTLEAGPGVWWTMGRSRLQSVNTSRTTRWRN